MDKIKVGDIVLGTVTKIVGYGVFVSCDEYNGLIHISELSDNYVKNIRDFVKVGDRIRLKVLEIDEENKRLRLSFKMINKTRGAKGEIPHYQIGFKTLRDYLQKFIQDQLKENDNDKVN